jgi:FixJ family two-component response regulator
MGTKKLVMVVDDESLIDSLMEQQVRKAGYEAVSFTEAEKALEYFVNNPERVHLAVVDVIMPGMTGIELVRRLRTVKQSLPIIIITGHPEISYVSNVNKLLRKPLLHAEFTHAIEELIGPAAA